MPKPTKPRAEFEALLIQDVLLIIDLNGPVSVTNDAEAVIPAARNLLGAPASARVVYRDSTNRWDELLCHPDGSFKDFAPIKADDPVRQITPLVDRQFLPIAS